MDAAEFILLGRQLAPLRLGRQRHRLDGKPLSQRRNQRMLFDAALQLPDAEADKDGDHGKREEAEAELPPSCRCGHFGSRSINRPGAAL